MYMYRYVVVQSLLCCCYKANRGTSWELLNGKHALIKLRSYFHDNKDITLSKLIAEIRKGTTSIKKV